MGPTRPIFATLVLAAAFAAAGCGVTQPLNPGDGTGPPVVSSTNADAKPTIHVSPQEACQLGQTGVRALKTGILFVKKKGTRDALLITLNSVQAGADNYCNALLSGQSPDVIASINASLNAAIDSLNTKLEAEMAKQDAGPTSRAPLLEHSPIPLPGTLAAAEQPSPHPLL